MSSCGQRPWLAGWVLRSVSRRNGHSATLTFRRSSFRLAASAVRTVVVHALDHRRWLVRCPPVRSVGLPGKTSTSRVRSLRRIFPSRPTPSPPDVFSIACAACPAILFIPFHTYYAALVGKRTFVHRMGVRDIGVGWAGRGIGSGTAGAVLLGIVLDWKTLPGEFPFIDSRYHLCGRCARAWIRCVCSLGADLSNALLVPTLAAPPVPAGWPPPGRLRDGHLADLRREGEAFGNGPAPHLLGCTAASLRISTRLARLRQGALRSAPFTVDQSAPGFRLSGPADPGLRVALLDDGKPVRDGIAVGRGRHGRMGPSDLVGRSVMLVAEDKSRPAVGFR